MKLTNKDKKYLLSIGHIEEDLGQIADAITYTRYESFETTNESVVTRLNQKQVIKLLGREKFLSGMSRSAFHYSAVQFTDDDKICVMFDSSKFFKY